MERTARPVQMTKIPKGENTDDKSVRWMYANFTNRFIFAKVLENNPDITIRLLKRFLPEIEIESFRIETEKHLETSGPGKFNVLDVKVTVKGGEVILIEMQVYDDPDFVLRLRHYRAQNDVDHLDKGHSRLSSSSASVCSIRSGTAKHCMISNTATGKTRRSG